MEVVAQEGVEAYAVSASPEKLRRLCLQGAREEETCEQR